MKKFNNESRRINKLCNEFIDKINKDRAQIKSGNENNVDLARSLTDACINISNVRELFILSVIRKEDLQPEIFADNQDLLLSASIGCLRRPIASFTNHLGQEISAADARRELCTAIDKLEKKAKEQLEQVYADWQQAISSLQTA